ncbi:MAG: hypothetical protein WAL59_02255 [Roseiarcus sp.]
MAAAGDRILAQHAARTRRHRGKNRTSRGLRPDDALAIFGAIREMPPVVNVFFELGREGENAGTRGVVAHKLVDMLHRTRLQTVEQLDACLQMINRAERAARNDPGATLYVLDPRGYCLIASLTQKSILEVWRRVVASQNLANIRMAADHEVPDAVLDFP